jgi:Kelch motif
MTWTIKQLCARVLSNLLSLLLLLLYGYSTTAAAQALGAFVPTSSMTTARIGHTSTLLLNGKVLIAGGSRERPESAELYDPQSDTFTPTGDMTTGRSGHSATLLSDGRVLIAGGGIGEGRNYRWLASSEIYDPSTETFTPAGTMLGPHAGHAATLLNSGKVLIDEGCTDSGVAEPELYDPVADTFSRAWERAGPFFNPCGSAVLLPDGRVFTVRGPGAYDIAVAGLYDPTTGEFSRTERRKIAGVYDTPATLLTDGTVLIAGGYDECTMCRSGNAEFFDPATGTFTFTGSMNRARAAYTATLLRDGTVLMAGGDLAPESAELYDPVTRSFAQAGEMAVPRWNHTATLLMDGRILITGGITDAQGFSPNASAELYTPSILVPAQIVADFELSQATVAAGSSYSVTTSGPNLTPQTFFDVRFTAPDNGESAVVLNWQQGFAVTHEVAAGTAGGTWTINGVRAHKVETDHTGIFFPVSAMITVLPVLPTPIVTDLRFDRTSVVVGSSFSANISGSNLTSQTFFDVRFTGPGSNASDVALNWQRGLEVSHDVSVGTTAGSWTINAMRAHEVETDHTGSFVAVSATIAVIPAK